MIIFREKLYTAELANQPGSTSEKSLNDPINTPQYWEIPFPQFKTIIAVNIPTTKQKDLPWNVNKDKQKLSNNPLCKRLYNELIEGFIYTQTSINDGLHYLGHLSQELPYTQIYSKKLIGNDRFNYAIFPYFVIIKNGIPYNVADVLLYSMTGHKRITYDRNYRTWDYSDEDLNKIKCLNKLYSEDLELIKRNPKQKLDISKLNPIANINLNNVVDSTKLTKFVGYKKANIDYRQNLYIMNLDTGQTLTYKEFVKNYAV